MIAGSAVLAIWACRGVFADGAFYLWTVLTTGDTFSYPSRALAQLVTQAPVVAAVNLGVVDLGTLLRLQSFGTIGIPTLIWLGAMLYLLRDRLFWPMLVVFSVVVLNSGFMSVGEYNFAYALVAASAAILLRRGRIPLVARLALVALAALMPLSYESLAVLGPLLAVLLVIRALDLRRQGEPWRALWPFAPALALYGFATAVSAWYIVFPRDPRNLGTASDVLSPLLRNEQVRVSLVAALLLLAVWAFGPTRARVASAAVPVVVVVAAAYLLVRPQSWATPGMHYDARALVGLAMFGLLLLIAIGSWREQRIIAAPVPSAQSNRAVIAGVASFVGPVFLLVALSVPITVRTAEFALWLRDVDRIVSAPGGPVPADEAGLPEAGTALFGWSWTYPYLSHILNGRGEVTLLPPGVARGSMDVTAPIPDRFENQAPVFPGG